MIRPLRKWHGRVIMLLAVTLPPGYVALLSHREASVADTVRLAAGLGGRVPAGPTFALLAEPRIDGRLLAAPGDTRPDALQVTPVGDPGIPDLLAYWCPVAGDTRELPRDAVFIGALRGSRELVLPLPEPGLTQTGYLILFSLARGEVLATVRLPGAT